MAYPTKMPQVKMTPPPKIPHIAAPAKIPQVSGAMGGVLGKQAAQSRHLATDNLGLNTRQEDDAAMTKRISDTLMSRLGARGK